MIEATPAHPQLAKRVELGGVVGILLQFVDPRVFRGFDGRGKIQQTTVQRGALLMFTASATGVSIEAPAAGAAAGVLKATVRQGPFEAALELRREAAP